MTETDTVVDPEAVYEDPPPEGSVPGGKEVRLGAVERTYIASGKAGTNYDSAGRLRLGYSIPDGQLAVRTLIRFDLGSIPRGVHVYSAQLELSVISSEPPTDTNQSMGIKVMTVDAGHNWTQGNASWNNAAAIGGAPTVSGSVPKQGTAKVNMIDLVKYWVDGGANHGIMIIGDERPDQTRVRNLSKSAGADGGLPLRHAAAGGEHAGVELGFAAQVHGQLARRGQGAGRLHAQRHQQVLCRLQRGQPGLAALHGAVGRHQEPRVQPRRAQRGDRAVPHPCRRQGRQREKTPSQAQATTRVITKAPTVIFNPLPTWTHATSFTVSWYATDALVGVSSYDIQYQVNNDGNWKDLIVQTQQTSFTFTGGQNETVYSFRGRARDSIGNEGTYPRQAGTETTVVLYPIAKVAAFNPNIIQSTAPVTKSFTVNWSGQNTPDTWIVVVPDPLPGCPTSGGRWSRGGRIGRALAGNVTSAEFPIEAGDGIYQFEATATDNLNQTTPYTGKSESSMIVDLADTFKTKGYLPEYGAVGVNLDSWDWEDAQDFVGLRILLLVVERGVPADGNPQPACGDDIRVVHIERCNRTAANGCLANNDSPTFCPSKMLAPNLFIGMKERGQFTGFRIWRLQPVRLTAVTQRAR